MSAISTPAHRTRRSTTPRNLRWMLVSLMITTTVVFGTTLWTFHRQHDTAHVVHTQTAPAILEITLARAALVAADRAAITSFETGEAQIAGPGAEYQSQLAIASQSLTQFAEHNAAGESGSRDLPLVNGLLVAYTSLIGQADAHYRQRAGATLGTADLWYASRLLHAPGSGILHTLDKLLDTQRRALETQLSATAVTPGSVLLWVVPVLVLLWLLGFVQVLLKRQFRRILNIWLLSATAVLLLVCVVMLQVSVSQQRLEASQDALYEVVEDWRREMSVMEVQGQRSLVTLVRGVCGEADACGDTVGRVAEELGRVAEDVGPDELQLTTGAQSVTERTAAAGQTARLEPLIYLLAGFIGAANLLGVRRHIDDYRFRP